MRFDTEALIMSTVPSDFQIERVNVRNGEFTYSTFRLTPPNFSFRRCWVAGRGLPCFQTDDSRLRS